MKSNLVKWMRNEDNLIRHTIYDILMNRYIHRKSMNNVISKN